MTGARWKIEVEVAGIDGAQENLRRIRNLGSSLEQVFDELGRFLQGAIIDRFDREHGPGGVPWPKSKRALGIAPNIRGKKVPGKTLTDSAELRNSLDYVVRANEVEVGFRGLRNPLKAIANQFGAQGESVVGAHTRTITRAFGKKLKSPVTAHVGSYGRINNIPARPMLGFDSQTIADTEEVTRLHLLGLFHG